VEASKILRNVGTRHHDPEELDLSTCNGACYFYGNREMNCFVAGYQSHCKSDIFEKVALLRDDLSIE
jgi:hypothetical protein